MNVFSEAFKWYSKSKNAREDAEMEELQRKGLALENKIKEEELAEAQRKGTPEALLREEKKIKLGNDATRAQIARRKTLDKGTDASTKKTEFENKPKQREIAAAFTEAATLLNEQNALRAKQLQEHEEKVQPYKKRIKAADAALKEFKEKAEKIKDENLTTEQTFGNDMAALTRVISSGNAVMKMSVDGFTPEEAQTTGLLLKNFYEDLPEGMESMLKLRYIDSSDGVKRRFDKLVPVYDADGRPKKNEKGETLFTIDLVVATKDKTYIAPLTQKGTTDPRDDPEVVTISELLDDASRGRAFLEALQNKISQANLVKKVLIDTQNAMFPPKETEKMKSKFKQDEEKLKQTNKIALEERKNELKDGKGKPLEQLEKIVKTIDDIYESDSNKAEVTKHVVQGLRDGKDALDIIQSYQKGSTEEGKDDEGGDLVSKSWGWVVDLLSDDEDETKETKKTKLSGKQNDALSVIKNAKEADRPRLIVIFKAKYGVDPTPHLDE